MGLTMKNLFFRGRGISQKINIERRDCLKRGTWTVCRFKRGAWQERGGGVFWGN